MSANALNYQLTKNLGSSDRLLLYFDFSPSSVFCAQSGSIYQAYLKNQYPSSLSGVLDGKIIGATGVSSGSALNIVTGVGGFLENGFGRFERNSIELSGVDFLNINNCSYLISLESELHNDGVILGSFKKKEEILASENVKYSNGFNFGLNSRGKPFFQSLEKNGEYCFIHQKDELSKKNVLGLSFDNGSVIFSRFDYLNEQIYSESFSLDVSSIKNCESFYLGSSPSYWRGSEGENLFSGSIQNFAILSGRVSNSTLYEIGKGLISDYFFETGSVTSSEFLSGYLTEVIYKTGITGSYFEITGYKEVRSGTNTFNTGFYSDGFVTVEEGDPRKKPYGSYFEMEGFLAEGYRDKYLPDGVSAQSTLGLQDGFYSVEGYITSGEEIFETISVPLYGQVYLTGNLNDISGIINTPVYTTGYITGAGSSGIELQGNLEDFRKNYIYYLGPRS